MILQGMQTQQNSFGTAFKPFLSNKEIIVMSIAADGTYLMADGAGLDKFNLKPSDVVGKNFFDLRKNSFRMVECMKKALKGESFSAEILHLNVWLQLWFTPQFDHQGNVTSTFIFSLVIDDRKKELEQLKEARENAEARSEAKSRFLAHVSHELRTPLTSLLGFTEILKSSDLGEHESLCLEKIQRGGNVLLKLVNELLDLSKIESGKSTIEKKRIGLCDLLSDVISFMEVHAEAKGIELKLKTEGNLPKTIYTDPNRIRQILINLVNNAIKFTEEGSVTIRVSSKSGTTPTEDILEFEIQDTGIGISNENKEKIFQPFVRSDEAQKYMGTGLGLVISKQWAERLGGSLGLLRSEPGKGSSFYATVKAGPFQ